MTAPRTPTEPPEPPKARKQEPSPWALVGIGMEFAGVVVLFTLGGMWLDGKWGTSPLWTLLALGFALVGSIYNLWRVGKRFF
jgi:hypothetical protein